MTFVKIDIDKLNESSNITISSELEILEEEDCESCVL